MNETMKTMLERRAVRCYKKEEIARDLLESVVDCARFAPSGMNSQPWKFIIVTDQESRKALAEKAKVLALAFVEGLKKDFPERYASILKRFAELEDPIFYGAPSLLFIAARGDFAESSAALAAENAMLAAKSLGLGTCPIGMAVGLDKDPAVRKMMKLEEGENIKIILTIGYPDEEPQAAPRTSETIWI